LNKHNLLFASPDVENKKFFFYYLTKTGIFGDISHKNPPFFAEDPRQFYNKEWANQKLRFAIGTLQGKYESSIWKRRLQTALICRDELLEHGFKWQATRIDNWIHRLQPRKREEASV
jgi:hypothetical protein